MKKSELKKFIKEELKKLIEQKAMMGGPLTHPIADTAGRYEITINSTGETIPLTGNPIESLISIASNMRGLERYSPEEIRREAERSLNPVGGPVEAQKKGCKGCGQYTRGWCILWGLGCLKLGGADIR